MAIKLTVVNVFTLFGDDKCACKFLFGKYEKNGDRLIILSVGWGDVRSRGEKITQSGR